MFNAASICMQESNDLKNLPAYLRHVNRQAGIRTNNLIKHLESGTKHTANRYVQH